MEKRRGYSILHEGSPTVALVGEKLKQDLEGSRIKQAELARLSGVDAQLIGRLCRKPKTVPDLHALAAIAKARRRAIDWYVWNHPPELSTIYEFFAYRWPDLSPEERAIIVQTIMFVEDTANRRVTLEKYKVK